MAPVRAFVGLWMVLKICDRIADTVLCMLAIVGGLSLSWIYGGKGERNAVEARWDFLVGGRFKFHQCLVHYHMQVETCVKDRIVHQK